MTLHISGGAVSAKLGEVTLSGSVDADGNLSATWSGVTGSFDVSYGETSGTIEVQTQLTLTGRVKGDSASGSLGVHNTTPGDYDESNSFNWQCSR